MGVALNWAPLKIEGPLYMIMIHEIMMVIDWHAVPIYIDKFDTTFFKICYGKSELAEALSWDPF